MSNLFWLQKLHLYILSFSVIYFYYLYMIYLYYFKKVICQQKSNPLTNDLYFSITSIMVISYKIKLKNKILWFDKN